MSELIQFLEANLGISSAQYQQYLEKSKSTQIPFLQVLEETKLYEEALLLRTFSKVFKIPMVTLEQMNLQKNIVNLIPRSMAEKYTLIPIDRAGQNLIVAVIDPFSQTALEAIKFKAGFLAKPVLSLKRHISEAIEKYYPANIPPPTDQSAKRVLQQAQTNRRVVGNTGGGEDGPIINIVNEVLSKCVTNQASDIHFENYEDFIRVRLRVDGDLVEILRPPPSIKNALISRVKIMSGLNIAESRLPQDGSMNIQFGQKPIDFRVSTIPTIGGEKIVLRILDKSNLQVDLTQLGLTPHQLTIFREGLTNPQGMMLVTGPTGSGKTTTLYSALQELNQVDSNIMTAEDPVEYQLGGINQVQMKSDIGLTFAAALRAFLRQDPDIIMVGEIRDLETAEISIKAALTGHMVLSTLHTNSAVETIYRLLNMGVEPFNVVAALSVVTAQRLLRKICTHCKVLDSAMTPEMLKQIGLPPNTACHVGRGCSHCSNSGSKGRIAVHEVLALNDPIKRSILRGDSSLDLKKVAKDNGLVTLRDSALQKLSQGIVSFQVVVKTTIAE